METHNDMSTQNSLLGVREGVYAMETQPSHVHPNPQLAIGVIERGCHGFRYMCAYTCTYTHIRTNAQGSYYGNKYQGHMSE